MRRCVAFGQPRDDTSPVRNLLTVTLLAGLLALPLAADARSADPGFEGFSGLAVEPPLVTQQIVQAGCMTLSHAIDSVRRGGNVERIISAETRGGTHHIKVLTKDGKVRTHRIPGC